MYLGITDAKLRLLPLQCGSADSSWRGICTVPALSGTYFDL